MRLPGYCTECHRVRQVRVSGASLVLLAARPRSAPVGICADCEEAEDARRRRRR